MSERLNIKFIPCLDFEMIKNLENCSLVFEDFCEEIYQEQAFVKLAVAGRNSIEFSSNTTSSIKASSRVQLN